jgi:hypothetical protein
VKLKTSIENGGGKNIEFMKWFVDWYKTINKQININFSVPNILSPFKEDNVIILDLFEKINQDIDAKPYLNKIIEKADDFGVVIYLEPTPRYKYFLENAEKRKKISKDYLIKYYKNFGFELTSNGQFMKRVPKMKNGGIIKDITCKSCNWSWNKSDSEKHDEYVCHKCGTDNEMKNGGTTDDFDWESLFNPSPEEEEKIKQESKKSEEQEKEDWYQGTKFSKEWAATYKDAINKTVKEYLDAKATYEDWGSRQYKSNKGVVYAGGDDIHGTAYTIGGINEYRRKKTMAGAKMLMDESIETLKDLRLTNEEISNLLQNKMEDGGSIDDLMY